MWKRVLIVATLATLAALPMIASDHEDEPIVGRRVVLAPALARGVRAGTGRPGGAGRGGPGACHEISHETDRLLKLGKQSNQPRLRLSSYLT